MFARKPLRALLAAGFLWIISTVSAWAVSASIWEVRGQKAFEAGQLEDIAIDERGAATLAPSLELVADIGELYIWCLAADAEGNLYAGSGNGGKVFRAMQGEEWALLVDLEEPDVLSMALDEKGNVYAGTSASGTIYKIAPNGDTAIFFASEEAYIWALVFDEKGNLYAATGAAGRIYKIAPDGDGRVLYDAPETHIMSLIRAADGMLYAGGEGNGIIYKISPAGEAFVLYDADETEVRCLAMGAGGTLYAGVISGTGEGGSRGSVQAMGPGSSPPTVVAGAAGIDLSEEISADLEAPRAGSMPPPAAGPPGATSPGGAGGAIAGSSLYKIAADGVVERIWKSRDEQVLALAVQADGKLILGTGKEGHLYSVDPAKEETGILAQAPEAQVTAMVAKGGGGVLLGCANMAKIYQLGPGYASEGSLESIPFDATAWSKWGRVSWKGKNLKGTEIALSTRSGNTQKPDSSWSPWTAVSGSEQGRIESPIARFVQWRAELKTKKTSRTPLLNAVSLSYVQRNLRPRVAYVAAVPRGGRNANGRGKNEPVSPPPGSAVTPPAPRASGGATVSAGLPGFAEQPIRGTGTIKWMAMDPNGDRLRHDLYFRGLEEERWKLLEEDLKGPSHNWDSESFPDGDYLVKVVASDALDNPPGGDLSRELISEPFVVDNTSPAVSDLKVEIRGRSAFLMGTAKDATSILKKGAYAVDGGELAVFFPADEIFDSREENFSFQIELPAGDEHTLAIRVVDRAGNVGVVKKVVRSANH